jgi:hypothetical protein
MCITRPPTCATQLEMGSNCLSRICTLPCMSATTTPYAEDVMVEIEVPTRRMCGLSARSCASLTGTTSKNGNCLHYMNYQRENKERLTRPTPGANVVDDAGGLEGVEGESIGVNSRPLRAGRGHRSRHWPQISHTQRNRRRRGQLTQHKTATSSPTHPWHSSVSASGLHP